MTASPILRTENLSKAYGALKVTDDVDFDLQPGELHAIIGPNGAGKTTLIHQLSGCLAADAGRIQYDGDDITSLSMVGRARLGISRTFQITSLLSGFSALENAALAVQARSGSSFRFFQRAALERSLNDEAMTVLETVGLAERADQPAAALSHGEQRQLELAVALATQPRVLLLDEPLAGTGHDESARLTDLILGLKRELAIILVEHDMEAVFALADRVSVMVYGRVIASGSPAAIRADAEVRRAYLGEEAGVMLAVEGLAAAYGDSRILFDIGFQVGAGEVVTLLGRNGMGKTTTIKTIFGLLPATAGRVIFDGADLTNAAPHRIGQAGLGLVPEGRQIFPTLTVEENLIATSSRRVTALTPKFEPQESTPAGVPAAWGLGRVFELFPQLKERRRHLGDQLSGGEQQMLAVGRALMTNPSLLVLDEATEGLAPLMRAAIWSCLGAIKETGMAILIVDKNVEALARLADHHVIIEKGRTVWRGGNDAFLADPGLKERYLQV